MRGRIFANSSTVLRYSEIAFAISACGVEPGAILRKQWAAHTSFVNKSERSLGLRRAEPFVPGNKRVNPARRLPLAIRKLLVVALVIRLSSWPTAAAPRWYWRHVGSADPVSGLHLLTRLDR